jgi:hypothetical protein
MTNFQEFFHDVLPSSNSDSNVMMLPNNDSLVCSNENFIATNSMDFDTMSNVINSMNKDDMVSANIHNAKTENSLVSIGINDEVLWSLKKENATTTARAILRYLYPNPERNFKLSDMNKMIVNSIISKLVFYIYLYF